MSAHNMDEWVSCADGMRGRADTESDADPNAGAATSGTPPAPMH